MKKNGYLFVVSAPSGCGKTTIVTRVMRGMRGIRRSVSITTRRPRHGEANRKDYFFVSEQTFKNKVRRGEFLEWAQNFGYYYGTPRRNVLNRLKIGDVLLTIDVKGAAQVKRKMPDSVLIFIAPPSIGELKKRLAGRGTDGRAQMAHRLAIAKKEMAYSKRYDYIIVNDRLDDAVEKVKSVITAKRCEVPKQHKR